ncbi:MAG TPA: chromosomal replication initiator protein DnaA [Candidatus Gracilibacteria bacterium]
MNKEEVWEAVLVRLSEKISRMEFSTWFKKVVILEISGNAMLIGCPTEMNKNWLENKYHGVLISNIKAVLPEIEKLFFQVDLSLADKVSNNPQVFQPKTQRKLPGKPEVRLENGMESRIIQAKFTLQNFIVGPENQFAHAACTAIAESDLKDAKKYNPLYVYGGVGLGKTHLLQGTANEILKRNPEALVIYTTAERFTNEMIQAIKDRKTEALRKKYRKLDVLLIDDVQFFSGKERTQVELFNTFNDLRDLEKQIIFSADRPPAQLDDVMDRLSSRMGWGLVVDVQMPTFETKVAIVQSKAKSLSIILPQDVQDFIATNIRKNLRELENVLNKIAMELELTGVSPTVQSVAKIFRKLNPEEHLETALGQNSSLAKSPDDVITAVSEYFQVPATDLLGTSRKQEIVLPRQICWLLCKELLKMSLEAIGEAFGGKNHTTIMHGIKKVKELIRKDSQTARHIHALKQELGVK